MEGSLALESTGENLDVHLGDVDESDTIPNQVCFLLLYVHGTYLFYLSIEDRTYPVDIEVIKARTHVPSETAQTREDFLRQIIGGSVIFVACG